MAGSEVLACGRVIGTGLLACGRVMRRELLARGRVMGSGLLARGRVMGSGMLARGRVMGSGLLASGSERNSLFGLNFVFGMQHFDKVVIAWGQQRLGGNVINFWRHIQAT